MAGLADRQPAAEMRADAASAVDHLAALKRLLGRDEPDYAQ
jgi:hypothetical protein